MPTTSRANGSFIGRIVIAAGGGSGAGWPRTVELAPEFLAIATPGHTQGHCVLLFQNRFLFTGDHLDWDRDCQELAASENYCWYSWPQQTESMSRLASIVRVGVARHGQRVHLPATRCGQDSPIGEIDVTPLET